VEHSCFYLQLLNLELLLQKHNWILISCGILIQHLGDHCLERIRQGAAVLGTDFHTAHAVDAHIVTGLAGVIQRNGTHRTTLSTDTALDTVFACRGMECSGF
jgi:hypothetical protein